MARKFYGSIDLSDNELLNYRVQMLPSDPSPLEAKAYYNTTAHEMRYHDGTSWKALGVSGSGGPPSGSAGGDLSGTYPNPQIASGVIVDGDVSASAAIAQSKIANLTTDLAARVLKAGDTMSGLLTLSADPTNPLHAATKQYVDLASQGFSFKSACRVASTANVPTLSGLLSIDGVTVAAGDRVLLKDQSAPAQNGIYIASASAWSRATDMDASGELVDGTLVPISTGSANADSQWMCTGIAAVPWVPGSTASTWTKWTSLSDLNAGAGLTKTGTTLDVVGDANLQVLADIINVLSAPKWKTARTLTLTGDVTGSVSIDGSADISLATTGGGKRYAGNLTAVASQVVTHNLNTRDVIVQVYNGAANYEEIEVEVQRTSVNTVTIIANPALPAGYRVVVLA